MSEASKAAAEKSIPQLCLEIRNLAHYAWNDPENAEYLFTEIEHRAEEIERHYRSAQPHDILRAKLTALSFMLTGNDGAWEHDTAKQMVDEYTSNVAAQPESTPDYDAAQKWLDKQYPYPAGPRSMTWAEIIACLAAYKADGAAHTPGETCPECGSTHKPCRIGNGIWNCTDPWHTSQRRL